MTLGDLGANVIKIERPGTGDETRGWGPPFDDRGESAYYLSVNRNKLSVALDLDSPEDIHILDGLIRHADVVLDNFRPGTLERRGVDIAARLEGQGDLLWCTLTGFGPESARPGYDFVVQAECGWMAITGEPSGPPMKVGVALADVLAGKDAAISILAGLASRGRGRTPDERRTFISLAASAVAALVNVAQNALVSGKDATRWGNAHANLARISCSTIGSTDCDRVGRRSWKGARALGLHAFASDRFAITLGESPVETIVSAMTERVASPSSDALA
jgi:crotonobetainyl-CoA:carnitine CoA-transferase CaiB-like acyl-CoA transferase